MSIDDVSLEPLLNQSSQGDGASRRLAFDINSPLKIVRGYIS